MNLEIDIVGPWIQATTQLNNTVISNGTNNTNLPPLKFDLTADICNRRNVYTEIHYVGFAITVVNGIGMFITGLRLPLLLFTKSPKWNDKYKPLLVACLGIIVLQPLAMFIITSLFQAGHDMPEQDQLTVILASSLPTWTFCFHFVRWSGGHIGLARMIQCVITIAATVTMNINVRIYATLPETRAFDDYGEQIYVPWSGISEIFANFICFILGGIFFQIAYSNGKRRFTSGFFAAIFWIGPVLSMLVYCLFVLFLAIECPQAYQPSGSLWGCACLQPVVGVFIGLGLGKLFSLKWQETVTIAILVGGPNVQYMIGTLINDYDQKQVFQSIISYPVLLYIFEIFWLGLFTLFLNNFYRLIPRLKNKSATRLFSMWKDEKELHKLYSGINV